MQPQFDDYAKFGESAMGSMKEFGDLTAKTIEKVLEQQMSLASTCWEATMKQMSQMSEAKGYEEVLSGQAALMTAYNNALMESFKQVTELLNDTKTRYTAMMERNMNSMGVKKP